MTFYINIKIYNIVVYTFICFYQMQNILKINQLSVNLRLKIAPGYKLELKYHFEPDERDNRDKGDDFWSWGSPEDCRWLMLRWVWQDVANLRVWFVLFIIIIILFANVCVINL